MARKQMSVSKIVERTAKKLGFANENKHIPMADNRPKLDTIIRIVNKGVK